MILPSLRCLFVAAMACLMTAAVAADTPATAAAPKLDPGKVYRFDPITESFGPIERTALKPFHIYYRFSTVLDRWVWSKTTPDGRLEFAMGPGSVQRAFLFDLTASMEERMRVLEERAPELARMYVVQGARASMRLSADGKWELHGISSVGHVYDLESGRRWEWHGDHRAEVVHGGGNSWRFDDERFVPAWYGVVYSHWR
jgi:hypothetical protein